MVVIEVDAGAAIEVPDIPFGYFCVTLPWCHPGWSAIPGAPNAAPGMHIVKDAHLCPSTTLTVHSFP